MTLAPGTFQKNPMNMLVAQAFSDAFRNVSGRIKLFFSDPRTPLPSSIKAVPCGLLKGNSETGYELYRGVFNLAGEEIHTGAKLCFAMEANLDWQRALHSFVWLDDLHAGGSELQRAQARSLITDWLGSRKDHPACATDLDVTARRLVAWLRHSSFLLEKASGSFEATYYRSLGRHVRYLSRHLPYAPQDKARLEAAIALCHGAVCLDIGRNVYDQAFVALGRELDNQILADGGHVSRNPEAIVEILSELLSFAALMDKVGTPLPASLVSAIDRMMPMLRLISHGDSGLAAFNGAGKTMKRAIRAIQDFDQAEGKPAAHARYSGYGRMSGGNGSIIIDCGLPPNPRFASNAHAGLFSFEFSEGVHRIVVNCGAPCEPDQRWARLARTTPAHSTATFDGESSSRIADGIIVSALAGGPLHIGPRNVACELETGENGAVFEGRHDGYARSLGLFHDRRLWINPQGDDFRGEDVFSEAKNTGERASDAGFAVRFHLHPSVKATISQDASSIMLLLPDRSGWRFTAKGARLALDESVYLVDSPCPQRTQQIVLTGIAARGHAVNWAFKKITSRRKPVNLVEKAPELPL